MTMTTMRDVSSALAWKLHVARPISSSPLLEARLGGDFVLFCPKFNTFVPSYCKYGSFWSFLWRDSVELGG